MSEKWPVTRKVAHKAVEAIWEFFGNKIADKIVKSKAVPNENLRDVEVIIVLPEKKTRNNERIKASIYKMERYKISRSLSDSIVSSFVTKKCIEVNDLSRGQYSVNKNIRLRNQMLR